LYKYAPFIGRLGGAFVLFLGIFASFLAGQDLFRCCPGNFFLLLTMLLLSF
jgi:hypothetical protein